MRKEPITPASVVLYSAERARARITLNRPERGNALTFEMIAEIARCVDRANLDPAVRAIVIEGTGKGFCSGYDLVTAAEGRPGSDASLGSDGSPMSLRVQLANHDPSHPWDPMIDYMMMSRNVEGFTALLRSPKPVLCKIQGFCVGGGTDLALCCDLIVVADDARVGYPPARAWGSPTTALWAYHLGVQRAKRLLFTGDCLTGREALAWGLAAESAPPARLDARFDALVERVTRMPQNQLIMMKLLVNETLFAQGLHAAQTLGTLLDGMARHTPEGHAFRRRAVESGFKRAVRERDKPFEDEGTRGRLSKRRGRG
jgi:enoyl-CoA hydratase